MAQQFVILSKEESINGELSPLGDRKDLVDQLGKLNTHPARPGEDILFGPGIRLELPPGEDLIKQVLLTIVEEEIAWLVIMRLARTLNWKIMDPMSGRELTP